MFGILVECLAAILVCNLIHGTHLNESSAAFFGHSRSPASAQCEPVSLNAGRLAARGNELERKTKFCNTYTEMCKEVSNFHAEVSLSAEVNGTEESSLRNAFSINSLILSTFHCWKTSFNRGMFLFTLSHGSYVVDQRSGDGRNSGRSSDVAVNRRAQIPEF